MLLRAVPSNNKVSWLVVLLRAVPSNIKVSLVSCATEGCT